MQAGMTLAICNMFGREYRRPLTLDQFLGKSGGPESLAKVGRKLERLQKKGCLKTAEELTAKYGL